VLRLVAAIWTIAFAAAAVVMIVMIRDQPDAPWVRWGALGGASAALAVASVVLWDKRAPRVRAGAGVLIAGVLIAAVVHADYQVHRNARRSAESAAPRLVEITGRDQPVVAEKMVLYRPELFYYAGVDVRRAPRQTIAGSWADVRGSWIVFHEMEFDALDASLKGQLTCVTRLPEPTEAVVARLP
jgi:hypothetical protein